MADPLTPEQRSATMAAVKSQDTKPELRVRRALHAAGFRYRLHVSSLPGKPDIVLSKYKLAIQVHGCLWHWHGCKRSRMPENNRGYWVQKIQKNVDRDQASEQQLRALGWELVVIWECELNAATIELISHLSNRRLGLT
jgi:DNA mismatch endonuclease, patch repair protein